MQNIFGHLRSCTRHRGVGWRTAGLLGFSGVLLCLSLSGGVASADIVINEIMYHPYSPFGTTNETEYVELLNTGEAAVDLGGYALDNGVSFTFASNTWLAAGGYLVVCQNMVEFTNAYPSVTNVVGDYSGQLRDGGERVTLSRLDEVGDWVTVATLRYIDGGSADGDGMSLELVNPGFAPLHDHFYGAWEPSTTTNGTPGRINSVFDVNPPPVLGNVAHDPPLPPANSAVTITAEAAAHASGALAGVTLNYRVDANPQVAWSSVSMTDNGKNGDVVAGDGVYTRVLPEFGAVPLTAGQMYEFTITVTGTNGLSVTYPTVNTSSSQSPPPAPYSYLCMFGEDGDYTGEYTSYHMLMTKVNRASLETRAENSRVLLDSTLITSDGDIFYNCGIRYRGNSSLKRPYNFRVHLPRGTELDGAREWDFNYRRALLQYLGQTVLEEAGYGCHGLNPELCHLWLNETDKTVAPAETPSEFQQIYVKFEPVDNDLLSKIYPGDLGNIYRGQNSGNAGLQVLGAPSAYNGPYTVSLNNPVTAWNELDSLCRLLEIDADQYPDVLPPVADVRQWARLYAAQSAMANGEGGFHCSRRTQGDDYYIYFDASQKKWVHYPWDMDEVIEQGVEGQVATNRSIWAFENSNEASLADSVASKFLFNDPILPYYAGDVADILETVMSDENMNRVFDDMGSKMTPAYRQKLLTDIGSRRAFVRGQVNDDLTLRVTGAEANGPDVSVASHASAPLEGSAPMSYTTAVRVNGSTDITWHTRELTTVSGINQNVNGWVKIGEYAFSGTGSDQLAVRRATGNTSQPTIADAVMLSNATEQVVVDNANGTLFYVASGTWDTISDARANGGSYRRNSASVTGGATWRLPTFTPGTYSLYVSTLVDASTGASDPAAVYEVAVAGRWSTPDAATALEVTGFNQNFDAWLPVGQVTLLGDGAEAITVSRVNTDGGLSTIADAIMLSNATAQVVVDNSDAGNFSASGSWTTGAAGEPVYGANCLVTAHAGDTATWQPPPFASGTYTLYAHCVAYGRFGTSDQMATYEVTKSGGLVLTGAVNTVLVEALNADGDVLKQHTHTIVNRSASTNASGAIVANTEWSPAMGVIRVTDDVTVGSGAVLTIAADTVVLVDAGKRLQVSDGIVDIAGTAGAPVRFFCGDGQSAWVLAASGGGSITGRCVVLTGGRLELTGGATGYLEDCELRECHNAAGIVSVADGGSYLELVRCIVSGYDAVNVDGGALLTEGCLFENMTGAGVAGTDALVTLDASTFASPGAAGISAAAVGGVSVLTFTQSLVDGAFGSGIRAVAGANAPTIVCSHSLLMGCATGISARAAGIVTNAHVTVTGGGLLGIDAVSATVRDVIVWGVTHALAVDAGVISYSDIEDEGTNLVAGVGNLNRNPWFRDTEEGDCRLLSISPCVGAAHDAGNIGTSFPVGANPAAPDGLSLTNVVEGGTNAIRLAWRDNSTDESWFEVERSADAETWTAVDTAPADATNYVDVTAPRNVTVYYRVRAAHRRGVSLYSDERSVIVEMGDAARYLRITELMYNPADPGAGEPAVDNNDFEFVELYNSGTMPLDLSGAYFDDGITYTFPPNTTLNPGAYYVLIQNPAAFASRYPGVAYDDVVTDGKLSNGGEKLTILAADGEEILSFTYADNWYPSTDGDGYSLVLADPEGDPDLASSWKPSGVVNGTPGAGDTSPFEGTIVINEILAHTDPPYEDAVELYNAGTVTVDIANWYLSDDAADLTKYRITNATLSIPAGGYHVLYQGTSFGQGAKPFALSELGDEVYLSSGDGTGLTSYRTKVSFPATSNHVAVGRYIRSDGEADFTELSAPTFGVSNPPVSVEHFRTGGGAANAYPLVGPVVINEIMYNPAATGKEFVELLNRTSKPVDLFNEYGVWSFDGAMEYAFPTNTTLAPGEHIVVVSILPESFRAQFGLTNEFPRVFGPYSQSLNNGGETVKLYRPGTIETNGFVPRLRADRVQYDDRAPWPTAADNGGPSLERIDPAAYGNDPANWIAASLGGTPGEQNNTSGLVTVAFAVVASESREADQTVYLNVDLGPVCAETVTVQYAVVGGTASAGSDYESASGTLVFWPYDQRKSIPLVIKDDGEAESNETVVVALTGVSSNARLTGNPIHTHTIVDTDGTSLPPPTFSPAGTNVFMGHMTVSLSSTVPGSVIYYTTDGRTPTSDDKRYGGPVTLDRGTRIKARTYLGSVNASSVSSALFLEATPPPEGVVLSRVSASSDDAQEESRFGTVTTDGPTLTLGANGFLKYVGVRFVGTAIPPGATVTHAHVQFTAARVDSAAVNLKIHGQAADDPSTFVGGTTRNISTRPFTSGIVAWDGVPAWNTVGQAGVLQQTPELAAVIQELIDRPGWTTNSAIVLIFENNASTGMRQVYSYDGDANKAPLLYMDVDIADVGPTHVEITGVQSTPAGFSILWTSESGRTYSVYRIPDLRQPWPVTPLASGLAADPSGTNAYTDSTSTNAAAFYRVGAQ